MKTYVILFLGLIIVGQAFASECPKFTHKYINCAASNGDDQFEAVRVLTADRDNTQHFRFTKTQKDGVNRFERYAADGKIYAEKPAANILLKTRARCEKAELEITHLVEQNGEKKGYITIYTVNAFDELEISYKSSESNYQVSKTVYCPPEL